MDEGLTIEVVYDDPDLVEIDVTASNGRFSGRTAVYVGLDELEEFADDLAGFPTNAQDHRSAEWGDLSRDSGSGGAHLQFLCVDVAGHAGVWVELKSAVPDPFMPLQTVRLFLPVEAAAVDQFVEDVKVVSRERKGVAHLPRGGRTSG